MAVYNPQSNILFLHVPKSAGSSITHSFFSTLLAYIQKGKPLGTSHSRTNIKGMHEIFDDSTNVEDCFIFSTVRNPYERFYSFYFTHMLKKRRVCPKDFTKDNFESFIINDYQPFIKCKLTSRKDSQDPQTACRDMNFRAWIQNDKMVDRKVCQNIYKKYYSLEDTLEQPGIRYLLFDNIQEEYRQLLDLVLRAGIVDCDYKSLEALEQNIRSTHQKFKESEGRGRPEYVRVIDQGLQLVNIAPSRGPNRYTNSQNPELKDRDPINFYTPKARKVFDRFNQEDIKFYNKLKSMSFEERFEDPTTYFDLVKDD